MLTLLGRALHRFLFGPWVSQETARRLEETEERRIARELAEEVWRRHLGEDEEDRERGEWDTPTTSALAPTHPPWCR